LTIPFNLGTPGKENSVRRKLLDAPGKGDLGPVVDRVQHSPPSPSADEPVLVKARVSDSGGVSSVQAFYRAGTAGDFSPVPLFDDGQHRDGEGGDGLFAGEIPGAPARTKVVFYVEAQDSQGNVGRFPREAPQRTCVYMAQGPEKERLDAVRVILDPARTT